MMATNPLIKPLNRKITTIKHKDYDEAVRFAENLNDYDFYAYCGKYGVPTLW